MSDTLKAVKSGLILSFGTLLVFDGYRKAISATFSETHGYWWSM